MTEGEVRSGRLEGEPPADRLSSRGSWILVAACWILFLAYMAAPGRPLGRLIAHLLSNG